MDMASLNVKQNQLGHSTQKILFKAFLLVVLVVVGGWLFRGDAVARAPDLPGQLLSGQSSANLLINGSFDDPAYPFRWRYPNHFVAGGWIRWWIHGTVIPEYDDVRPWRPYKYDGEHAQAYFKWGASYIAGIYQVVNGVTPCVPYRFTMWARNHSIEGALPHARIGLDPQGTQLTPSDDDCAVKNGLPPLTVWSGEQTALFKWEELTVEAEPLGNRLTAILYAAPRPSSNVTHYYDTFWDAGRLVELPFPDGRLPEPPSWTPSGFIQNLQTTILLDTLLITWDTPQPASTQVWYQITGPRPPRSLSETAHEPASMVQEAYPLTTTLDTTPVTQHRVLIEGLKADDTVSFVALSRRPTDAVCVTEVSDPGLVVISDPDVLEPESWAPSGFIQNLSAKVLLDRLVITWETPEPSVAQVWYDIISPPSPPPTSSGTLSYTTFVYLPLVVSGFGGSPGYSLFTPLELTRSTHHKVVIEGLSAGDTVRFVALSGRIVDYRLVTDVSAEQRITVPDRVPPPVSWNPSGVVQNLVITASFGSLTVGWDTPGFSSTTQVWYNVLLPSTSPTGTLVYTYYVYLPLVMSGSQDRNYQFATPLDLKRTTCHQARIENLPDGAIVTLVALSSDVVNDSVVTEVSAPIRIEVDTSLNGMVYPLPPGP